MKTSIAILALAIVAGFGLVAVSFHSQPQPQTFGSVEDIFSAANATSTFVVVNTTSTQVLDGTWTQFALISAVSSSLVSCSPDNQTAASSAVALGSGVTIFPTSTAGSMCFGRGPFCIPYIGAVNCISSAKTNVSVFKR